MRIRITTLAALVLSFLVLGSGAAETASSAPLYTFYGEVKSVDPVAKTLTIKSGGKSFFFHVTNETKISSQNEFVRLDTIKRGQGALVVMRIGERGKGIAVSIRFDATAGLANSLALYSVKTNRGETISGMAFNNYVVYQPPPDAWSGGATYEKLRSSMFVLFVRPDGTVADAKPLRGLGYPELDARAVRWLKKWCFRANSVTEARMPIGFSQSRY